ncbi:MAG: hypothetical protein KQH79_05935 [Bacteroidetes bacterium]|nr:hypothetical protein [Bacteroidota bacterium]
MLKPTEYYYLSNPLFADAAVMLKYTLQDLCYREILRVDQRWIQIHERETRKRLRFYFSQGENYASYVTQNTYENFFLKLFENHTELRFYQIRQYIKSKLEKDVHKYKRDYVFTDLLRQRLCVLRIFTTGKGRKFRKEVAEPLGLIERSIDILIESKQNVLLSLLEKLGSNVLLLNKETLDKLDTISEEINKISKLKFLSKTAAGFSTSTVFMTMNTSAFGASVFAGGGSFGGFGGFGGGSFGGGGAGGSW